MEYRIDEKKGKDIKHNPGKPYYVVYERVDPSMTRGEEVMLPVALFITREYARNYIHLLTCGEEDGMDPVERGGMLRDEENNF